MAAASPTEAASTSSVKHAPAPETGPALTEPERSGNLPLPRSLPLLFHVAWHAQDSALVAPATVAVGDFIRSPAAFEGSQRDLIDCGCRAFGTRVKAFVGPHKPDPSDRQKGGRLAHLGVAPCFNGIFTSSSLLSSLTALCTSSQLLFPKRSPICFHGRLVARQSTFRWLTPGSSKDSPPFPGTSPVSPSRHHSLPRRVEKND